MKDKKDKIPIKKLEEKVKCDFKKCLDLGKHKFCYKAEFINCSLYKGRFDTTGNYGSCH